MWKCGYVGCDYVEVWLCGGVVMGRCGYVEVFGVSGCGYAI